MKEKVQDYLVEQIPLSKFMQIEVVECDDDQSMLKAPLAPNKNDKGIAFGGSLAVMAKLAAWSRIFQYTQKNKIEGELLIGKAETRFLAPGRGELVAICESPSLEEWKKFEEYLEKKGRARIILQSHVESEGVVVLEMTSSFAAVKGFS